MKYSYQQLMQDLQAGKLLPLYFLMGEESFFIDQLCSWMENQAIAPSARAFNQTVVYGREVELAQILALAQRYPMMAERQLILVREAQHISQWEKLMNYLDRPVPTTTLVFAYRGKKLDRKTKLYKKLEKNAAVMVSEQIPEYKMAGWLRERLHQRGLQATEEAQQMLLEYLGNDLSKVDNALEKLAFNQDAGERLTAGAVSQQVGASRDYNLLTLRTALLQGDAAFVARVISYAESNPKALPIQQVTPFLYRLFAQLMVLERSPSSPQRAEQAKKAGISEAAQRQLIRALPLYRGRLESSMRLLETYAARSVGVENVSASSSALLKELLFRLLPPATRSTA